MLTRDQEDFYQAIETGDLNAVSDYINPPSWKFWRRAVNVNHVIQTGHTDMMGLLRGTFTPLFVAVYHQQTNIVRLLVEKGAEARAIVDVRILEYEDQPLSEAPHFHGNIRDFAIRKGYRAIAASCSRYFQFDGHEYFNLQGGYQSLPNEPALFAALRHQQLAIADDLLPSYLELRYTINEASYVNNQVLTPLQWSVQQKNLKAMMWSLNNGADANYDLTREYSVSSIYHSNGKIEISPRITEGQWIQQQVSGEVRNLPLHFSCENGDIETGYELARYGAKFFDVKLASESCQAHYNDWHSTIQQRRMMDHLKSAGLASVIVLVAIVGWKKREILYAWSRNGYCLLSALLNSNGSLRHIPTLFIQKKLESAIRRKKLPEIVSSLKKQPLVLNEISKQNKLAIQKLVLGSYQNPVDEKNRDITESDEELIVRSLIRSGLTLFREPVIPLQLQQKIDKHSKERLLEITNIVTQTCFNNGAKPLTEIVINYLK